MKKIIEKNDIMVTSRNISLFDTQIKPSSGKIIPQFTPCQNLKSLIYKIDSKQRDQQLKNQGLQFYYKNNKIRIQNTLIDRPDNLCYIFPSGFYVGKIFVPNQMLENQLIESLINFFELNKEWFQVKKMLKGNGTLEVYVNNRDLFWDLYHLHEPIKDFFDLKFRYLNLLQGIYDFDEDLLHDTIEMIDYS